MKVFVKIIFRKSCFNVCLILKANVVQSIVGYKNKRFNIKVMNDRHQLVMTFPYQLATPLKRYGRFIKLPTAGRNVGCS
jgi:hypothetical protein